MQPISARTIIITTAHRLLVSLVLATMLLPLGIGPAAPAHAKDQTVNDHRAPTTRLRLIIKRIIVHEDMDWGIGEANITFQIRANGTFCEQSGIPACGHVILDGKLSELPTTDGSVITMSRPVPAPGDSIVDPGTSPEFGIAIRQNEWYGVVFQGTESDPGGDDFMGFFSRSIVDENGQVQYGSHTERARNSCTHQNVPLGKDFCGTADYGTPADGAFSVEYEVVQAPLPDLRPFAIKIQDIPGSPQKLVCVGLVNAGPVAAGPFQVLVRIDGLLPPNGTLTAGGLAATSVGDLCAPLTLPATGRHRLSVMADAAGAITELSEINNDFMTPYIGPNGGANPGPMVTTNEPSDGGQTDTSTGDAPPDFTPRANPAPTAQPGAESARADLTIAEIKVNGQAPGGKAACKDGKNTVTVVVKNSGTAKAATSTVLLTLDGGGSREQSIGSIDAGKQREVSFDEVRLKRGEHTLRVTADAKEQVPESDEGINARTIVVRCTGDD